MWLDVLNGFVKLNRSATSTKPIFPILSLGTSWNRILKTNAILFNIYDISNTKRLSVVSYEQSPIYSACREVIVNSLTARLCVYKEYFPLLITLPSCKRYNKLIISNIEIILRMISKEYVLAASVDEKYSMFRNSSNFIIVLPKSVLNHTPLLSLILLLLKIACVHGICKGTSLDTSSSDISNEKDRHLIKYIHDLYKNDDNLTKAEKGSIINLSLFDFDLEKIKAKIPDHNSFGYGFLKFSNNV